MRFEQGQTVYVGSSRRACVVVESGRMVVYVRAANFHNSDIGGRDAKWPVSPACLSAKPPAKLTDRTVSPHESPAIRRVRTSLPRRGLVD